MEALATLASLAWGLIDLILHVDVHLEALVRDYGVWVYAILFAIIFCETGLVVTPVLPGDSLLFVAGAIAAIGGMQVHLLVALLIAAAILGDAVNYGIGKHFGDRLSRSGRWLKQQHIDKTHAFYEKYGGGTLVMARFVPFVRTYAPFVAGIGHMGYAQFARYNVVGAILWVTSLTYLGYFFGNVPLIKQNTGIIVIGIIGLSVIPLVVTFLRERAKRRTSGGADQG